MQDRTDPTPTVMSVLHALPTRRASAKALLDFLEDAGFPRGDVSGAIRRGMEAGAFVLGPQLEIELVRRKA